MRHGASNDLQFLQSCLDRPACLSNSLRKRVVVVRAKLLELGYHPVTGLEEGAEFGAFVHADFDSAPAVVVLNARRATRHR